MRRDIHQWFLAGIALSFATTIIVCIMQDAATAMPLLIVTQGIILILGLHSIYKRRIWREICTDMKDDRFRSHELRCRLLAGGMNRESAKARRTDAKG